MVSTLGGALAMIGRGFRHVHTCVSVLDELGITAQVARERAQPPPADYRTPSPPPPPVPAPGDIGGVLKEIEYREAVLSETERAEYLRRVMARA